MCTYVRMYNSTYTPMRRNVYIKQHVNVYVHTNVWMSHLELPVCTVTNSMTVHVQ